MFIKFYLIGIHAILLFDFIVAVARIPVSKCMQIGWDQCNIHQIDINPADRMVEDDSCYVDRGSNVTISFNFTPHFETYNLKWAIWVETLIGDYKVEGVSNDARNFSNHPTLENKINPFQTVVHIPDNIRSKLWVIRATLMGDSDRDLCCFLCKIRIREPKTTTVSSATFDPTNPYDIIRRQVSFPSIWDFNEILKNFQNNTDVFNKFVFDNVAVTTPKPGYLTIMKNAFKRLLGIQSEPVTPAKVPFLGNASNLMEYFNDVILANNDKKMANQITTSIAHRETRVNIKHESTKEIITEETTLKCTTASSSKPEKNETVEENKADPGQEEEEDEDEETGSSENDPSKEETTSTTVQTTRTRTKLKTTTRTSQPLKRKTTAKGNKSPSTKAARVTVKKTVRPSGPARRLAKSTTS